jgi:hypothetical protein
MGDFGVDLNRGSLGETRIVFDRNLTPGGSRKFLLKFLKPLVSEGFRGRPVVGDSVDQLETPFDAFKSLVKIRVELCGAVGEFGPRFLVLKGLRAFS